MKYFCGKHRDSSAPPHNLRSKNRTHQHLLECSGGVLGTSLCTGKGRCVCMMGTTDHVPQKTQKIKALQKTFHLPHPNFYLYHNLVIEAEIQQIQLCKELRQTQSQPHRRLPWDLGVTLGYQLSSSELRKLWDTSQPLFSLAPKEAWPCNPFKPPR